MILFKQVYWLSCCHLTFRKIWYCWLKLVLTWFHFHFHFSLQCNKTITVFCIGQYKFLWTLEINIHLSLKALVNIIFKVHTNLYWPQQKTIMVYCLAYDWTVKDEWMDEWPWVSWSCSYGSWVYNYLYNLNQCLSPLKLWVWSPLMVRCTRYTIMW